jgi:predicted metal-dependent phosphoesterase TrpH
VTALRVAAHVHSTWSYDGEWALEDLARAFARRGYDAVLMSEHDRTFDDASWERFCAACSAASACGAVLVPGIEYSDAANCVHVPVWGAPGFLGRDRPTGELLADARAAGGLAVIAHPDRREAWRTLDPEWLELAHGIEIWNRKCDGWAPSRSGLELAAGGHGLRPFVGLDFHSARQFFPLTMVAPDGGAASVESVLRALRARELEPVAFGSPAGRFAQGRGLEAARASERVRRPLARAYRRASRIVTARR